VQAEADPLRVEVLARVDIAEQLEKILLIFLFNSDACVLNRYLYRAKGTGGGWRQQATEYENQPSGRRELQGVGNEVLDDLLEALLVGTDLVVESLL